MVKIELAQLIEFVENSTGIVIHVPHRRQDLLSYLFTSDSGGSVDEEAAKDANVDLRALVSKLDRVVLGRKNIVGVSALGGIREAGDEGIVGTRQRGHTRAIGSLTAERGTSDAGRERPMAGARAETGASLPASCARSRYPRYAYS